MLNLISVSLCGVLSFGVVLSSATAAPLESNSTASNIDSVSCAETITQLNDTPIQIADADGSSGSSDRRGAGRRN
ncbi:MAG: hypothetical protein WBA77_09675 [Microcoleaceae cyanobacterium]